MSPITGAGGVFRFGTLREHVLKEPLVTGPPVGADRVIAGIVTTACLAEIRTDTALKEQITQRSTDGVRATWPLVEDAGSFGGRLRPP